MMDLYTAHTPNGHKVSITLEELKIPYRVYNVKLGKSEFFHEKFLPIRPSIKIPFIVDRDKGLTLFESGTILIYLAEKVGRLLPENDRGRLDALQWLFVQTGLLGPSLSEWTHYCHFSREDLPTAVKRYQEETLSFLQVLAHQLTQWPYLAGAHYSIADVAMFSWIHGAIEHLGISLHDFSSIKIWYDQIIDRPAVQKGLSIPLDN